MSERSEWFHREANGQIRVSAALRDRAVALAAVYALFAAAFFTEARLWRPGEYLSWRLNPHVAEAVAWYAGQADLPERLWDTAEVDGRVYNIFPPMMTFVSLVAFLWSPLAVPFTLISALFVLPVPALAFALFLRRCDTVFGAAVMACIFVLGTSEFLILCRAMQSSKVCQLNNAITQVGLLIFLIHYFGRRRFWLGGIGLIIMGWARQPMMAYLVPYLWGLWDREPNVRSRVGGVLFCVVLVVVPAIVTTVRFGHPLRMSYDKIYVGRQDDPRDWLARDGTRALFSARYVPRNLYWMNIGLPTMKRHHGGWRWQPSVKSTGIWWTTPVLLFLFVDGRRIWRERANRWLMASVLPIFATLMLYHNMGYSQRGYNRFSLDFLLVLLAFVAPPAMRGRRRYLAVLCGMWSVYYFRFIVY